MANIILIGLVRTGKSTIADLLSRELGYPRCSLDQIRYDFYKTIGYDEQYADEQYKAHGFEGKYRYWKPFEAALVLKVLSEYRNHVIDFGGGHSVYEDPQLLEQVKAAMAGEEHVFLLLPSDDIEESLRILNEIEHESNYYVLAKRIIYTKGKSPEETVRVIMEYI